MCTTILVVMATCIVQGMLMEPLIRYLGVPIGVDVGAYLEVRSASLPRYICVRLSEWCSAAITQARSPPPTTASSLERYLLYPFVLKPWRSAYQVVPDPAPRNEEGGGLLDDTGGLLRTPRSVLSLNLIRCFSHAEKFGDTLSSGGGDTYLKMLLGSMVT
jgi:hypothetical protein